MKIVPRPWLVWYIYRISRQTVTPSVEKDLRRNGRRFIVIWSGQGKDTNDREIDSGPVFSAAVRPCRSGRA
ncbi:MAG: hypothetical protein HQK56_00810 [Deltaproteobacteria bacterium]|nr:hypothetical protein [Deltaproteobacteria bacterium]